MRSLSSLATSGNMAFGSPTYGSEATGWYTRRKYDLKDKVVEIAPQQTPFLTVLSRFRKMPTSDPLFRFFEHESNWYRMRQGKISTVADTGATLTVSYTGYDGYASGTTAAEEIATRSVLRVVKEDGSLWYVLVTSISTNDLTCTTIAGSSPGDASYSNMTFTIVGSGYEWGGSRASDVSDDLSIRYGKTQIFKTAYSVDNTLRHTTLYGGDEMMRLRAEKMMEHKADIERAFLFGSEESSAMAISSKTIQFTDGLYEQLSASGKSKAMTYAGSGYNDLVDLAEEAYEFGTGNKLFMVGPSPLAWFSKNSVESGGGFIPVNSYGQTQMALSAGQNRFGLNIRELITPFGNLSVVYNPLLRGDFADTAFIVDMNHVAYRPLQGRDTSLETNVEDRGTDGIIDQYLTEAGLQVENPEAHVLVTFS